jgi:hypothetical protein
MDSGVPQNGVLKSLEQSFVKGRWDLWVVTGIAALMAFLLYDFKVSEGGDDSAYVSRAFDLLKIGRFPSFQGPIYPIFLSGLIGVFGLKLQLLKISSALFMVLFFHWTYRLLRTRIPVVALFPAFALAAMSPLLLYFASQTYSEAFFLFLLAGFLSLFLSAFVDSQEAPGWKAHLLAALWIWLLGSTRTVGYASLPAVLLFLAIDRNWISMAKITASFSGVFLAMQGLKTALFGGDLLQFSSQGGTLLLKDPYTPTDGQEDVAGFIDRFMGNADLYLSKHYLNFLGLRKESVLPNGIPEPMQVEPLYTWVICLLLAVSIYFTWKNRTLRFLSLLTIGFIALTFLAVQTRWDQARLILPYLPFCTLIIFSGLIYSISKMKSGGTSLQWAYVFGVSLLAISLMNKSSDQISESQAEFKEAISGRPLAGYTPDWQNYILMSQYATQLVPEEEEIACRKAGISFIYGGRKFVGITKIPFLPKENVADLPRIVIRMQQLDRFTDLTGLGRGRIELMAFGEPVKNSKLKPDQFYFTFALSDAEASKIFAAMDSVGMKYWNGLDPLVSQFAKTYLVDPDQLLRTLKDKNVHYVVMGSLRRNPNQRSEFIINTIQRYLSYIQTKYPNALQQIHRIGDQSMEPASLIKIDYAQAGWIE